MRDKLNIGIHRGFVNYSNSSRSIALAKPDISTTTPVLTLAGVIIRVLEALRRVNLLTELIVVDSELSGFLPNHFLDLMQPVRLDQADNHRFRLRSLTR